MNCIISFANNRGNYYAALDRLENSLHGRFDGHFIGYRDEASIGAPPHLENPYAFKVYAFRAAFKAGFRKILYVDSCVFAVADVQPAFDLIEKDGYLMQEAGHYLRNWCNDATLQGLGLTREDLGDWLMYGNAGMLGLDFDHPTAKAFFFQWALAMEAGLFKGSWDDHRHDMTLGSIIANQLGMKYQPGDQILQYARPDEPVQNETIIFKANGL